MALGGSQRLLQVCQDVLDVLDADGKADEAWCDAHALAVLFAEIGVGHGRRVADERFDSAQALAQRTQPDAVEHGAGVLERAGLE